MKKIGTVDGSPIYLVKKDLKSMYFSRVKVGDDDRVIKLGSLLQMKPYANLELDV